MRSLVRAGVLAMGMALAGPAAAQDLTIDSETFGGLTARSIGPAVMSGRIAALDVAVGDRLTMYAGSAGGGLWKSDDGGLQFSPVFDKHSQSIGAVPDGRWPSASCCSPRAWWSRASRPGCRS